MVLMEDTSTILSKEEVQDMSRTYKTVVDDLMKGTPNKRKWKAIHELIKQLDILVTHALRTEQGEVYIDRLQKLALYATGQGIRYYSDLVEQLPSEEKYDSKRFSYHEKIGDLSRYAARIYSVPRRARPLTPRELAKRDWYVKQAVSFYETSACPAEPYFQKMQSLFAQVPLGDLYVFLLLQHRMIDTGGVLLDIDVLQKSIRSSIAVEETDTRIISQFAEVASETIQILLHARSSYGRRVEDIEPSQIRRFVTESGMDEAYKRYIRAALKKWQSWNLESKHIDEILGVAMGITLFAYLFKEFLPFLPFYCSTLMRAGGISLRVKERLDQLSNAARTDLPLALQYLLGNKLDGHDFGTLMRRLMSIPSEF